jgi:hypothetical protein
MDLINATRLAAGYTIGTEPSGREHLVVVVKGTFEIPTTPDEAPALAREQVPVLLADELAGESGALPIAEADLCLRKQRCDVLVSGSAYAPEGRPTSRVQVGVRIGAWTKTFVVTGDRRWLSGGLGVHAEYPRPFDVMPITYERAFGGVEVHPQDPTIRHTYRPNPIGCGFSERRDVADGVRMPNTEQIGQPIERPDGAYPPIAFGPVGRHWFPRYTYAGTYDQRWLEDVYPFLPADFDERYYQCTPDDQQIPFPAGGEDVVLLNLTPAGRTAFRLPVAHASITVAPRHADREEMMAVIDTIVLEPELNRFILSWRCSRPLRRSLFEIDEVVVGNVGDRFLRERDGLPLPFPEWAHRQRPTTA